MPIQSSAPLPFLRVESKTKVETTYEHVSLIKNVLGYWRQISLGRIGNEIIIHLVGDIKDYDTLYINGKEIPLNLSTDKTT